MRKINNMQELKMAQIEVRHKITLKEMELQAHSNALKELLNPMTYINLAISKVAFLEQLAVSFVKGYTAIREFLSRTAEKGKEEEEPEDHK